MHGSPQRTQRLGSMTARNPGHAESSPGRLDPSTAERERAQLFLWVILAHGLWNKELAQGGAPAAGTEGMNSSDSSRADSPPRGRGGGGKAQALPFTHIHLALITSFKWLSHTPTVQNAGPLAAWGHAGSTSLTGICCTHKPDPQKQRPSQQSPLVRT